MAEYAFGSWPTTSFSGAFSQPLIGGQNLPFGNGFESPVAGGDTVAPVITNVSPPSGTQLSSRSAPVEFDVTDVDPGLRLVIVTVKYTTRTETQLVFDGSVFVAPFASSESLTTIITDGYHFKITPENQWLGDIQEFFVYAIDKSGNLEGLP